MNEPATGKPPQKHPNSVGRASARGRNVVPLQRPKIEWSDVPNQLLRDAIVAVTHAGAAIMLGRTTDGGALSITVLDGDDKIREWPHTSDEVETTLKWLVAMYDGD